MALLFAALSLLTSVSIFFIVMLTGSTLTLALFALIASFSATIYLTPKIIESLNIDIKNT